MVSCSSDSSLESNEPQPDLDDAALTSAVDIRAIGCQGQAVRGAGAVIEGGFVLTAAHVVAGARSTTVRPATPDTAATATAHLVAIDPANDLALLATTDRSTPSLALGRAAAGDVGIVIVFRQLTALAQPFIITRPVNVRIFDIYHHRTVHRDGYQVAIEIEPGDSGGVLIGPKGTAVGVLYAKSQDADDRAWATSTSPVSALLKLAKLVDPNVGIDSGACAH
jgi:S1-C subfamily serine protease